MLFLFAKVLGVDLPWVKKIGRPRTKTHLPVVLSPDDVARILCLLKGEYRLIAQLLYGAEMRISEGLQLRVKDVDFGLNTVIVRESKGGKDRALMLPQRLVPGLREQRLRSRVLWRADQVAGRDQRGPVLGVRRRKAPDSRSFIAIGLNWPSWRG